MKKLILLLLMIVVWGCSPQNSNQIPEQLQGLENLTIYSADPKAAKTISFIKDTEYGESEDLLIGIMGEVVVDSSGRVYIADIGNMVIYAFEPDGEFIGQLGREGSGPGEFSSFIKNLQIHNNRLYAFDPGSHRLNIFTLDSMVIETGVALAGNRSSYQILARTFPRIRNLYVRGDDTYIAEFIMYASQEEFQRYHNIEVKGLFYLLDNEGMITRELLEFKSEMRTRLDLDLHLQAFFGNKLPVLSSENRIYLAEPDNFLVKVYTPNGDYQSAFFYPVRQIPITRESVDEADVRDRIRVSGKEISLMETVDLPETWPVLTDMKIDDHDRFWIAVTVEDMSIYEWWVLQKDGEMITRFEWPRDEPIEVVKNGFMYTRQTDKETGLQQIVRYRIELEEV